MNSIIKDYIEKHIDSANALFQFEEDLQKVSEVIWASICELRRIYVVGNGGSAADAQHFVAELVGRFRRERRGFPAFALTTNTSTLTAISNDYAYEDVFSRQVRAYCRDRDIFIAISTSGRSSNILSALSVAREICCITIGLTGKDGGEMKKKCDYIFCIPCDEVSIIQETHMVIMHILASSIENIYFTSLQGVTGEVNGNSIHKSV